MKKVIALVLVILMSLSIFAGCQRDENDKGPIIKMYLGAYPTSLDPSIMQTDSDITKFLGLIFEPLTTIDEKGNVKPALAKSWYGQVDRIDGQYKMIFELNETKWSDGISVSADDIVYAWKRILQPETESPYASLLYPIKNAKNVKSGVMTSDDLGLVALGDLELEVTFETEYDINLFAETVACIGLVPLREVIVLKDESNWTSKSTSIVTNGPFKVQTLDYNSKIVLERSAYYRIGKDDAFNKYVTPYKIIIEYKTNSGNGAAYQESQYDEGNLYYLGDFSKEGYEKYKSNLEIQNMLSSYTYFFNTTNELLSDAKVRQALSIALDRTEIANIVGRGVVPATGYVPHGVFDTNNKTEFRTVGGNLISTTANLEQAKTLLKEAGVNSGSFSITYKKSNFDSIEQTVAEYAKSVWEELGFTVTLNEQSGINYTNALSLREFDVIALDIMGNTTDAFGFLAPFAKFYSGCKVSIDIEADAFTPHYSGLQDNDYDALIDSVVYVSDRTQRAQVLHDAEKMLIELMPATALYFNVESYVKSSDLSNIKSSYFGYRILNKTTLKDYMTINSIIEAENNAVTESEVTSEQ
ncbi:MAG: hypothetical protein A2Y17_01795 [Clostridiales bacterium GWF2_38_85]|nr:MAG: hypothetical protein A2Y17_01795 [Clostridiales bacterium GWF2_38_85]HBL84757.1 hypothetical protein [Clostridiales bacterium]